jgi:hypothetical protein
MGKSELIKGQKSFHTAGGSADCANVRVTDDNSFPHLDKNKGVYYKYAHKNSLRILQSCDTVYCASRSPTDQLKPHIIFTPINITSRTASDQFAPTKSNI